MENIFLSIHITFEHTMYSTTLLAINETGKFLQQNYLGMCFIIYSIQFIT